MTFENFIKSRLIMFAVGETVNDPSLATRLAVVQCLANRVAAGWFGGDWMQVIDNAPDVVGTTYPENPTINSRDPNFREMLRRVDDVYYGTAESAISVESFDGDEVHHPLYYCEAHNVNREWFKKHVLSDPETHRMAAQVGSLTFFM